MEEITDLSYDSLIKYFNSLRQSGYKSYSEVYKLTALIGLEEILDLFKEFITEDDLKYILSAINCLSGTTCLIDFPRFTEGVTLISDSNLNYFARLSEANSLRTSYNSPRLME